MSRSGVTSRSALPHSGPSRLGGHSRLRKPTSTSIRAISNFGTSKSRTCARLGCLRIERWAREGIARANVAFPPNCNVHCRDRERQLYVGSRRRSIVSNVRIPALRRSRCNGKNAQIPVIPKRRGEWVNSTLSARSVRSGNGRNAPESGPRRYGSRAPGTDFPCIIAVALIRPFPSGV